MILFISPDYGTKPDTVSLIQAARKRGIETNTLLNKWDTNHEREVYCKNNGACAPYGDNAFCEFIAQEMQWNLYSNSLDWVTKLNRAFKKRQIDCMTLGEVIDTEAKKHTILGKKLLEPADDHQAFPTGVYNDHFPRASRETKVLVHDEVPWQAKFRFIIVHGKVETFCCYRLANVFNETSIHKTIFTGKGITADAFVQTVISHNNMAPACVLDVGFIMDEGWAVCGTYPVWSSDLYGCDPDKFLKALFVSCEQIN